MIKRVSDDFIENYSKVAIDKKQDGYTLSLNYKPGKRVIKDIEFLFSAFGGCEKSKFVYEFTYNPSNLLTLAINCGYLPLAHMNYCFIPTQINRTMNSYLAGIPANGNVLYPFYGYGDFGATHLEYKQYGINRFVNNGDVLDFDANIKYDAIYMRPQFSGNLAWAAIRDYSKYLSKGGKLITIVDSKSAQTPVFNNYMNTEFNNVRCYRIPELTWTPVQYQNYLFTYMVYGEKK